MRIGYVRVSTQEQNTIRQEVLMKTLGVDELYIAKAQGKYAGRKPITHPGFNCVAAQWR